MVNTFPIIFTDDPFGASSGQTRFGLAGGSVDHFAKLRRGHLLKSEAVALSAGRGFYLTTLVLLANFFRPLLAL
jgi:hypothetical protein